ncbi:unnamed protein product, partial [Mesorhabditis belari]|uniref:Rab proteins geranylgeranyltransferase component A n=1 Tax=Mesorhabditis belari TaxID=2138241 RepID=A0AAF3FDH2_9BILA
MDDSLPDHVDVVIVGTGLPEAILAAACSRSGLSVLHLDRNPFYGENWASFNLNTLDEWIGENKKELSETTVSESIKEKIQADESYISFGDNRQIFDLEKQWTEDSATEKVVKNKDGEETTSTYRAIIEKEWRRFSIDITPKILLSRGTMVQTLCDSEVSKYAEFKCVNRLLCFCDGDKKICRVPYNRSEIFETDQLSFVDKRRIMKFMQFCLEWSKNQDEMKDWKEFADKSFSEFLATVHNLEGSTQRFITDAIAILEPNPTTLTGLQAVCRFIDSVGVFGPSPFLYPLYGCGELPQCFCRLCAVFGGLYALHLQVDGIILKENKVVAVVAGGQRVNCDHIITSPRYAPKKFGTLSGELVDRAILVTDDTILKEEKEQISILSLASISPPQCAARLFEAGYESCLAPRGYYLSQLTGARRDDKNYLKEVEEKLYDSEDSPRVLMRLRFASAAGSFQYSEESPTNFAVLPPPNVKLDYSDVIISSRELFTKFWPDRDFLPRGLPTVE